MKLLLLFIVAAVGSIDGAGHNPLVIIESHTPWIKEFLLYELAHTPQLPSNKPLKTKIRNYGSALSNENNLSQWTRKLVDLLKEDPVPESKPSSVNVSVDRFYEYLVKVAGFYPQDLSFLTDPLYNGTTNDIELHLSAIKRKQMLRQNISIAGEKPVHRSIAPLDEPSFLMLCLAFLLLF